MAGEEQLLQQDCWARAGGGGTSPYLPFVRSHWLTSPSMRNAPTAALEELKEGSAS